MRSTINRVARIAMALMAIGLLAACAGAGTAQRTALSAAETGQTIYVACRNLPVHASASAFSPVRTTLPFQTAVQVSSVTKLYKPHDADDRIPAWAQIRAANTTGFVGARCLVAEDMLERQRTAAARAEEQSDVAAAGKGFSENEEDEDLIAARGAAGGAELGKANYARIDAALAARDGIESAGDISAFMNDGGLRRPQ